MYQQTILTLDSRDEVEGDATIRVKTQRLFRAHRLIVPPEVGDRFIITDIRVDRDNRSCLMGPVSASLFAPDMPSEMTIPDGTEFTFSVSVSLVAPTWWKPWRKGWFRWWVRRKRGLRFVAALVGTLAPGAVG